MLYNTTSELNNNNIFPILLEDSTSFSNIVKNSQANSTRNKVRSDRVRPALQATLQVDSRTLFTTVPSNTYKGSNALIPGMGEKTKDSCGDDCRAQYVTCSHDPSHDRFIVGGTSCGRRECPVCYHTWLQREADRIGCRIQGFRQFDQYPPKHVIETIRPGQLDEKYISSLSLQMQIDYLFRYFIKRANADGIHGGAIIIHPYRTTERVPRDTKYKKWDWVRRDGQENYDSNVTIGYHAHVIGYGYLRPLGESDNRYTNKGFLRTRDDIERVAKYALSHSPVIPGKVAVRYFGSCSYSKLKPIWKAKSHTDVKCSICGAPLVYEGTNELYLVVRTIADWVQVIPNEMVGTGPPGGDHVRGKV